MENPYGKLNMNTVKVIRQQSPKQYASLGFPNPPNYYC